MDSRSQEQLYHVDSRNLDEMFIQSFLLYLRVCHMKRRVGAGFSLSCLFRLRTEGRKEWSALSKDFYLRSSKHGLSPLTGVLIEK